MIRFNPEAQLLSTRRVEALTDGVFAIAMTLLVLDLKVTDLGSAASNGQLLEALSNMQANLISFTISFLLLGSMWAVHVRQFEYITKTDRHLVMINTLRLFAVVLIPFTTSIAGTYSYLPLGKVLFPINFFVMAVIGGWEWHYAVTSKNRLYGDSLTKQHKDYAAARNKAIITISFCVVIASLWAGQAAFILFFLTPIVMRPFLTRREQTEEAQADS